MTTYNPTIDAEIARMNTPERAAYVADRFQEMHNRVQEMKAEIKAARKATRLQCTQNAPPERYATASDNENYTIAEQAAGSYLSA